MAKMIRVTACCECPHREHSTGPMVDPPMWCGLTGVFMRGAEGILRPLPDCPLPDAPEEGAFVQEMAKATNDLDVAFQRLMGLRNYFDKRRQQDMVDFTSALLYAYEAQRDHIEALERRVDALADAPKEGADDAE